MADHEDDSAHADDDVSAKHPLTQAKSPFGDDDKGKGDDDDDESWQPPVP